MEQRVEILRKGFIGPFSISRPEAAGSDIPSMTEHESSPGRQVPSQHDREVNDILRGVALRDQAKNRLHRDTAVREGATKVWQRPTGPKFVLNPGKPLTWGESNVGISGRSETKVASVKEADMQNLLNAHRAMNRARLATPSARPVPSPVTNVPPQPGVPPQQQPVVTSQTSAQPTPQQQPVQQQKRNVIANVQRGPLAGGARIKQVLPASPPQPSADAGAGVGGTKPPPSTGEPARSWQKPQPKQPAPGDDSAPMTLGQYRQMRAVSGLDPRETYDAAKTHLGVQPSWHQRLASNPWVQQFGYMAGAGALQSLAGRLGLGNNMFTGALLPMMLAQKIPQMLGQHSGTEGYQQQLMQRAEQGQLPQLIGGQSAAAPVAGQATAPAAGAEQPGRARGSIPSPAVLAARAAARRRQAVRAGAEKMRDKAASDVAGLEPAITHFDFPRIVSVLG